MKILVVAYYYGWSSSVGSRRMRGLVSALAADGHQVTVLAADPPDGLTLGAPPGVHVVSVPPTDRVLAAKRWVARVRRGSGTAAHADAALSAPARGWLRGWLGFPDTMWEWTYRARRAARRQRVRPDLVLASAPPMAALATAAALARDASCAWIADMRDLWTGDPYRLVPAPLRPLDRHLERRLLRSAAAVTTVADSLADELRTLLPGIEVTVLRNGFDAAWLRPGDEPPGRPATVVYTGTLTANTGRDLGPLCDAVAALGDDGPLVEVFGSVDRSVRETIRARGMADRIHLRGTVGADDARRAQHHACALLNFSWEDPRDFGKLPAKVFEYAAARRPIVHMGRVETLGTHLIRDHGLGFVVDPDQPSEVAALLRGLADGSVEWVAPDATELAPLSQQAMVDGFRGVIESVSRRGRRAPG